ncbi:hypothetical protein BMS3Bbin04_01995 [bacterium BMS3Bbin04]|nr:hypothetical protein BMS3Bbin04_01995 [bacterium BMS3Bbin04]
MSAIKNDRCEFTHDAQRTHVHHQVAITETSPTFGQKHRFPAALLYLINCVYHIFRGHELPLLHIYSSASFTSLHQEIGLATEKCRYLQHIYHIAGSVNLQGVMHVGDHRNTNRITNLAENLQTFIKARTTFGEARCPVRFVK